MIKHPLVQWCCFVQPLGMGDNKIQSNQVIFLTFLQRRCRERIVKHSAGRGLMLPLHPGGHTGEERTQG